MCFAAVCTTCSHHVIIIIIQQQQLHHPLRHPANFENVKHEPLHSHTRHLTSMQLFAVRNGCDPNFAVTMQFPTTRFSSPSNTSFHELEHSLLRLVMEGANFNMMNPNSARNSRYKAGVQKRVCGDAGAREALLLYYGTYHSDPRSPSPKPPSPEPLDVLNPCTSPNCAVRCICTAPATSRAVV